MRIASLLALTACAAWPAAAAQTTIEVKIGPELQREAEKSLGEKEVAGLAADLKREVARSLDRTGVLDGAKLELTLVSAKPNRPTFRQLSAHVGLSLDSYGVGGATIEGRAIAIDGTVTPLRYSWYETDIRNARFSSTWGDADNAFYRFATRLARGDTLSDHR